MVDRLLSDSGRQGAEAVLQQGGLDCTPPFEKAHFLDGFGHPDGRFRFCAGLD